MSFLFNNSSILNNYNIWTGKNIYKRYLPSSKLLPESKYDLTNKKYVDYQNQQILNMSKLYTNTKCEETLTESKEFTTELVTNTNLTLGSLIVTSTQYVLKFFPITTTLGITSAGNYNVAENLYLLYTKSVNLTNDNYIYAGFTPQLENVSGGGPGEITNATIKSIVFDSQGNMYLGGDINKIGSQSYNNIVKWDGKQFSSLGTGVNGQVLIMYIDSQDNLYVGGSFSKAGGITCNNIAMWDGTNWNTLGNPSNPGVNANVTSIVSGPGNSVYVGGDFSSTNDSLITLNYVALWDGTTFSPLGSGQPGSVYAMASIASDSNANLYVGGYNIPVSKWDGTNWTILQDSSGNILNQIVNTMEISPDSNLYIGGTFGTTVSFNIPDTNNLVKFVLNTNTWVPINNSSGAGLNGQCYKLIFDQDSNLYVGGFFSNLTDDSLVLNGITKYILATSTFEALGSGIPQGVESLGISPIDSTLWIGGNFYQASNQYIYGITNYTNDFINLIWKNNNMGILTKLNPSTIVYTNNDPLTSKYIGFNQAPINLISNY